MTPYGIPYWIILVFLFLYGAVLGSFLNVCIYRIPQFATVRAAWAGLWNPPSRCPRCGRNILLVDNIPIIGWLKLRGRCRFCRRRISVRYPLIELFNGLLFVALYWAEIPAGYLTTITDSGLYTPLGPRGVPGSFWFSDVAILHWRYVYHGVMLEALLAASFIDIDLRIIPDAVTIPAMLIGVLGAFAVGRVYLVPVWFQDPSLVSAAMKLLPTSWPLPLSTGAVPQWCRAHPHWHGLSVSVAGLLVGGGVVWLVRLLGFWILRQEAMGFGDVILMAMIGSFVGWQPVLVVFFLAPVCALLAVAASVLVRREREIPYGPYISLATLLLLLAFQEIWPVAERIFSMGVLLIPLAATMVVLLVLSLAATQLAKRMLGIPLVPSDWDGWPEEPPTGGHLLESTAADTSRWRPAELDRWPGILAGRGELFSERWRRGSR
ncbi:MAG: prepilin peptidase [Planctomycetota bacterium]|nr:MAG: prepilin peptidase [Planctomycetota bacterium]